MQGGHWSAVGHAYNCQRIWPECLRRWWTQEQRFLKSHSERSAILSQFGRPLSEHSIGTMLEQAEAEEKTRTRLLVSASWGWFPQWHYILFKYECWSVYFHQSLHKAYISRLLDRILWEKPSATARTRIREVYVCPGRITHQVIGSDTVRWVGTSGSSESWGEGGQYIVLWECKNQCSS